MSLLNVEFENVYQNIGNRVEKMLINTEKNLGKYAEDVRKGIVSNLNTVKSYDGSSIAPNKLSTKKAKGNRPVFYGKEGILRKNSSIIKKQIDNFTWEIFVTGSRANVMYWLQQGNKPMAGERRAFGINEDLKKEFALNLIK